MKLHEMTAAIAKLHDDDSLDEQTIKDTLESIEGDVNEKGVNIVKLTQGWDADISAIDEEIKRLTTRKKAIKNRTDQLRDYLRYNMQASGITKIECPLFTVSLRKTRDIVSIDDESLIPDDYVTVKTTVSPNKAEILKALKSGADIPGASITESEQSLVIK